MPLAWNKQNISNTTLNTNSINTTAKTILIGQHQKPDNTVRPIAAIFAGTDKTILNSPADNVSKIFFSSDFDYLRIQKIVEITLTLPARAIRATTGGKKRGSGKVSYNGYADYYIHQHDLGEPLPAFAAYITEDAINGDLSGHALTGSIPLQFNSGDTFRLGLLYANYKYLVLRERYQVYGSQLDQKQIKLRIYYFHNTSNIYSQGSLNAVHSPVLSVQTNNEVTFPRTLNETYTISGINAQDKFNQVEITRIRGGTGVHLITNVAGIDVPDIDPTTTAAVFNIPLTSTVTISTNTTINSGNYSSYSPAWSVLLRNTNTGAYVTDTISATQTFTDKYEETALAGLAGKFFNGNWRSVIATGNIGTYPLTTANESSNVPGMLGGVNLYSSIAYQGQGDNYGFIAIGYFFPPVTGNYTFYTNSDDGSGMWIGALALPDGVRTAANAAINNGLGIGQGFTKRGRIYSLTAGSKYAIRIVHEEVIGGDGLYFTWSGPGIAETADLSLYFKTPTNSNGTIAGRFVGY